MRFSFNLELRKMKSLRAVGVTLLKARALAEDGAAGVVHLSLAMAHCLKNMRLLGFLEKGVVRPRLRQ